jgi:hypothetical protein
MNLFSAKQITYHWAGIIVALFIAWSVIAPHLLWKTNPLYQGVEMMGQDAEEHYIARVEEIDEGNLALGNTFLADKDKPYLQPPLGEMVQAALGRVLFLNAEQGIIFAKFFFPFFMALVFYGLGIAFFRSRIAALFGEVSAMIGHLLMSSPAPWLDMIHGILPAGAYSLFSRPINPQISSLVMFGGLLLFYRAFFVREKPRWWEVVGVGAAAGASLYMSPYTFSFLGGVIGLSVIWFLYKRMYAHAVRAAASGALALLAGIHFAINYLALRASPDFAALAARQGLVADRDPVISIWLVIMLAGALFVWPKAYKQARPFFIIMIATLWILTDQNALTGLVLHPSHYHWYITKPLLGIMLGMYAVYVLNFLFKRQAYIRIGLTAAGLCVLLYTSPLFHPFWYQAHPDQMTLDAQAYGPVIRALQALPPNQTVWAEPLLSLYIPIYTTHNAPNNEYDIYYLNPQSFYENAIFLSYRLKGETPRTILAALTTDRADVSHRLYGLYYRQAEGDLAAIPDEKLAELAGKYATFYAKPWDEVLKELNITVVVVPATQEAAYSRIPGLHLFESAGSYDVYTVAK